MINPYIVNEDAETRGKECSGNTRHRIADKHLLEVAERLFDLGFEIAHGRGN
jgi:hypothetical protein